MEDEVKIKKLSKIFSRRFPFIKELKIEDWSYSTTLFLDAKIDAFEMCETFGFKPNTQLYRNLNTHESNTFMGFVVKEDRDKAYETTKKINTELTDINELMPEQFRIKKSPHIHRFFGIDNPIF